MTFFLAPAMIPSLEQTFDFSRLSFENCEPSSLRICTVTTSSFNFRARSKLDRGSFFLFSCWYLLDRWKSTGNGAGLMVRVSLPVSRDNGGWSFGLQVFWPSKWRGTKGILFAVRFDSFLLIFQMYSLVLVGKERYLRA